MIFGETRNTFKVLNKVIELEQGREFLAATPQDRAALCLSIAENFNMELSLDEKNSLLRDEFTIEFIFGLLKFQANSINPVAAEDGAMFSPQGKELELVRNAFAANQYSVWIVDNTNRVQSIIQAQDSLDWDGQDFGYLIADGLEHVKCSMAFVMEHEF